MELEDESSSSSEESRHVAEDGGPSAEEGNPSSPPPRYVSIFERGVHLPYINCILISLSLML